MRKLIEENIRLLTETRKHIHAQPELSGHEFNTQQHIIDFLEKHCSVKPLKVGSTGVLAEFEGKSPGKNVLIRGDIDALPIQEINNFEHKSTVKGVSHKCGHDGHTAIVLGLAILLSENPINRGKVTLLFQPSEENGEGAAMILNDSYFSSLEVDYAFALHNLPEFPLNEVVLKNDTFTCNVKSVFIKLEGKTAHAAEPEKGYNPAKVIASILQYSNDQTHNDPTSEDFFLITPVHVNMGKIAYGISAGHGEVHLTIRSRSTQLMEEESKKLEAFVKAICKEEFIQSQITWLEEFYANENNDEAVSFIRDAANENQLSIHEISHPFKWGEDFGLFTQRFKGAMLGLGAGKNTPALHNPDYDFPDELIPTGAQLFYTIITKTLDA